MYSDGPDGLIYYSSLNFSFEDDYFPYLEYKKVKPSETTTRPGIVGYGVYLPKFRIKNDGEALGVKERTVPFADENSATFAVEAGRMALMNTRASIA